MKKTVINLVEGFLSILPASILYSFDRINLIEGALIILVNIIFFTVVYIDGVTNGIKE